MWQFMPYGDYGLKRNPYVDERFDPEKSTRAYARYMKYLYSQLGDWYLAMAAYDWGAGNVQRAVQKTGYADFWELYKRHNLPGETQNYVPEILAAIIIANHPTQYGFDDITLDPPVLTDTVTINYAVDLRLVSDLVNAPVDELMALNPSLLRMATPPDIAFDLHLPAGGAALFEQRIAGIPESKRTSWRYHRVTADDSLASVARTYHVTIADLADANQMREDQGLSGMEALVVPVAPVAAPSLAHAGLHHPARRYSGFDRRSLRGLARPAAALEQDSFGHQGRPGTPPARGGHVVAASHQQRRGGVVRDRRRRRSRRGTPSSKFVSAKSATHAASRPSSQSTQAHNDAKALRKEAKIGVEPYYILVFSCALAQAIATMASACGVELSAAPNDEAQREPLEAMEWMKY